MLSGAGRRFVVPGPQQVAYEAEWGGQFFRAPATLQDTETVPRP